MTYQTEIEKYYAKLESKYGYTFVLGNAKHFGYYPDKIANIPEQKARELHQDLIAQKLSLHPGALVLDAGCGRGVTACYIAEKYNVHIIGIDLLDFELKKSKEIARQKNLLDKTEFRVMNYSDIQFPENHFDGIYTSETLSHAIDVTTVLKQFFKVLKPNGKIVLCEYALAPDQQFSKEDMESLDYVINGSAMFGLKQFRQNNFLETLKSVGFIDTEELDITQHVRPSFDRLYAKSKWFYRFAKFFGFERNLINTSTPTLLLPLLNKGLIKYFVFTAKKPM